MPVFGDGPEGLEYANAFVKKGHPGTNCWIIGVNRDSSFWQFFPRDTLYLSGRDEHEWGVVRYGQQFALECFFAPGEWLSGYYQTVRWQDFIQP